MQASRNERSPVPAWFVSELAGLYVSYPSSGQMPSTAPAVWWGKLRGLSPRAVSIALQRAPHESPDPVWMPSAELVRRIAVSVDKTLDTPKADLSLPALPEPEPVLEPSNPFYDKLEAYKRGEIPRGPDEAKAELDQLASLRGRS